MREALKLALEALENHCGNYKLDDDGVKRYIAACEAIKEALAQSEQEPINPKRLDRTNQEFGFGMRVLNWNRAQQDPPIDVCRELWVADELLKLITPSKRPWVGLTNEETDALRSKTPPSAGIDFDLRCRDFARAIEAKLKELNT